MIFHFLYRFWEQCYVQYTRKSKQLLFCIKDTVITALADIYFLLYQSEQLLCVAPLTTPKVSAVACVTTPNSDVCVQKFYSYSTALQRDEKTNH